MGNVAISIENIGKRYRIGLAEKTPDTLRETIRALIGSPFHYLRTRLREPGTEEIIWALRKISFEVKHGEIIGIIGRNGAGKSTLLKILSRITEPTEGCAKIYGRVGSLLEVGTGFHPELTGRENLYLNGAILGMRRTEINKRFDEIVDFSGIEKFIDTPVKRYSSGMYVRLAFAVAAHLNPEILLVDEVLAVGDVEFQKKCLGKMGNVAREGRTVLFVSHNMMAISMLCSRAILLDQGSLIADNTSEEVIKTYLNFQELQQCKTWPLDSTPGDEIVRLTKVQVVNQKGKVNRIFDVQDPIQLEMEYIILAQHKYQLVTHFRIFDELDRCLFITADQPDGSKNYDRRSGCRYKSTCIIPGNLMNEGTYYVTTCITTKEKQINHLYKEKVISFQVIDSMRPGGVRSRSYYGPIPGIIRPLLKWEIQHVE